MSSAVAWLERGECISTRIRFARCGSLCREKGSEMGVMIGIDPHKVSHTAVVVDDSEVVIDQIRVKTTANGHHPGLLFLSVDRRRSEMRGHVGVSTAGSARQCSALP